MPETLTLNATIVTLTFESDYAVTADGFEIEFKVQSAASTGVNILTRPRDFIKACVCGDIFIHRNTCFILSLTCVELSCVTSCLTKIIYVYVSS